MRIASLEEIGWSFERLYEIRKLLNLWLWKDFVDDEMVKHVTIDDPNFEPRLTLYALDGDRVVGILIGARRIKAPPEAIERDKGVAWVKVVAGRDRSVIEALLREFEELARSLGIEELRYGNFASWYLFPGVDADYYDVIEVLESLGWKKVGRVVDYEVDLSRFYVPKRVLDIEEKLSRERIEIERSSRSEAEALAKWVLERFGPAWKTEVLMAFSKLEPTVLVAKKGSEVVGFSCYSALHTTWFGPIGVDERFRGSGVGTVLLFRSLEEMRLMGVRIARIPWTEHLYFYAQVPGVCGIRLFLDYRKSLR